MQLNMSLKLLEKYWQHLKKYENVIIISYYSQNIVWFRFKMFAIFPTVPAAFRNFNRWLCSCLLPQQKKKDLKVGPTGDRRRHWGPSLDHVRLVRIAF